MFAYRNVEFQYGDIDDLIDMKNKPVDEQPVPFVGPPVLVDREASFSISQMPAAVTYVAPFLNLLPKEHTQYCKALKVLMDCNDVLMEICRYNGSTMWTPETWSQFRKHRLPKWLGIFEESFRREWVGQKEESFADVAVFALFGNMMRCLPELTDDIKNNGPKTFDHCEKLRSVASIQQQLKWEEETWGQTYCGGQIEKSIREQLALN